MTASPEAMTLKWLQSIGYRAAKCNWWNSFAKRRVDLLGIADIIAWDENQVVLVQPTVRDSVSARINKITGNVDFSIMTEREAWWASVVASNARTWLLQPNRKIMVVGWAKTGPRGGRKLWPDAPPRIEWITSEMFSVTRSIGETPNLL